CAAVALGSELRERLATHEKDVWSIGDRFGIIDDRWSTIQTDNSREGRLDARNTALAFERFHQRRLFADLIRARAGLRNDVEVDAGAEDIFAKKTARIRISDGLLDDLEQIAILAAQINEPELSADGETGDHGAFNHSMRIVQEDHMIFACSRFRFVAVHQNVLRLLRLLRHKRPLQPGGEARAATAAKSRGLHRVDDPLRPFSDGLLDSLIT